MFLVGFAGDLEAFGLYASTALVLVFNDKRALIHHRSRIPGAPVQFNSLIAVCDTTQLRRQGIYVAVVFGQESAELIAFFQGKPSAGDAQIGDLWFTGVAYERGKLFPMAVVRNDHLDRSCWW